MVILQQLRSSTLKPSTIATIALDPPNQMPSNPALVTNQPNHISFAFDVIPMHHVVIAVNFVLP